MILISLSEKPIVFSNCLGKHATAFPASSLFNQEGNRPLELNQLQPNPIAEQNNEPSNVMKYVCNVCKKQFTDGYDLKEHMLIHKEGKLYTCDVCGKSVKRKGNLKMDVLRDGKPFICRVCMNTLKTKSDIKKHKIIHTGTKTYTCNVCGKSFARTYDLKMHNRTHSIEKPYACIICGKKFAQKCNLYKHKKIHEPK